MTKSVIYLLSSNYSGSHFLSLMLGSHSRFVHLGELRNLLRNKGRACATCGDAAACSQIGGLVAGRGTDVYAQIFQRLPEHAEVLVDTSKKPDWFKARDRDGRHPVRRIHLLRDPRALVRRWSLKFVAPHVQRRERFRMLRRRPTAAMRLLLGDMMDVYLYKWLRQNQEISAYLKARSEPNIVVTYEEVAGDQVAALTRINGWLGYDFEPGQENYWRFVHHGTEKYEYEWVKQRDQSAFFDLRWQEFLDAEQQRNIIGHRALTRYLDGLGLAFGDRGLECR